MNLHPARKYDFDTLFTELEKRVSERLINTSNKGNLRLYNYSDLCTYDRKWDDFTLMARGLILDIVEKKIVATPFPKFFNYGEMGMSIPDLPFEVYEKLDGSMITLFYHDDEWQTATRGSFYSDQAKWAKLFVDNRYDHDWCAELDAYNTYIFEAIYPQNKIVVNYSTREELVLLGVYREDGSEWSHGLVCNLSNRLQINCAEFYSFNSFADLVAHAPSLTRNEEGFVVRFFDGTRVKVKGDEYKRVHRMISDLSPLSIWNAMYAGDNLEAIRKELPEEFWEDFDNIRTLLLNQYIGLENRIFEIVKKHSHKSAKEIGLDKEIPSDYKSYLFNEKKHGHFLDGKGRETLFKTIRPDGNVLPGYSTSASLVQAQSDS